MRAAVEIVLLSRRWADVLPDHARIVRRAARAALALTGAVNAPAELAVALADDTELRRMNRAFRGRDKTTNVLSFPGEPAPCLPPGRRHLGDVALALGQLEREAHRQGKPLADHLSHLVVHGVLHLLGHDHETKREALTMEAIEVAVLAKLGVADPYRSRPRPQARPMPEARAAAGRA
jgi:probable rRNA maturation factor